MGIFGDYDITDSNSLQFRIIMAIPFILIFFTGSALSIRLFVNNVFELAKMQSVSVLDLSVRAQDIPLNARQQTILHLSAKYIALFYVASLSTILTFVLGLTEFEFVGLFASIDICINLLCLHLQFNFAVGLYQKCCCCWDSCCRTLVQSKAKKSIFEEYQNSPEPIPLSSVTVNTDEDDDIGN